MIPATVGSCRESITGGWLSSYFLGSWGSLTRPSPAASAGTVVPEVCTPLGAPREVVGAALPVFLLLFLVFIGFVQSFPGVMQLRDANPCVFAHVLAKLQFLRESRVVLRVVSVVKRWIILGVSRSLRLAALLPW